MKKILIIEDYSEMLEMLSWQIEKMGFTPIIGHTNIIQIHMFGRCLNQDLNYFSG